MIMTRMTMINLLDTIWNSSNWSLKTLPLCSIRVLMHRVPAGALGEGGRVTSSDKYTNKQIHKYTTN